MDFAFAEEGGGIADGARLEDFADHLSAGSGGQFAQFGKRFSGCARGRSAAFFEGREERFFGRLRE